MVLFDHMMTTYDGVWIVNPGVWWKRRIHAFMGIARYGLSGSWPLVKCHHAHQSTIIAIYYLTVHTCWSPMISTHNNYIHFIEHRTSSCHLDRISWFSWLNPNDDDLWWLWWWWCYSSGTVPSIDSTNKYTMWFFGGVMNLQCQWMRKTMDYDNEFHAYRLWEDYPSGHIL